MIDGGSIMREAEPLERMKPAQAMIPRRSTRCSTDRSWLVVRRMLIMASGSAAIARARFRNGVNRPEAWKAITQMFRDGAPSLVGGSYHLKRLGAAGPEEPKVGDAYAYQTPSTTVGVWVTAWNPSEFLAYDELVDPPISALFSHASHRRRKRAWELSIVGGLIGLELEVLCVDTIDRGFLLSTFNRIVSPRGTAFGLLDGLVGEQSAGATAWAGGWKRLPIGQAQVEPVDFEDANARSRRAGSADRGAG